MKLIDQSCLSDSRFSSDKDYLPLSFQGLIEVSVQLSHGGFATNHFSGAVKARVRERPRAYFSHRGYELISAPRKRFDEFRFIVTISQSLTDAQNIFLDDLWVYIRFRPRAPSISSCVTRRSECSTR